MSAPSNSPMLSVKDLSKHFGDVKAVRNISFEVKKGEVFGFLGPNGAGKTTTMRMITCFIPPTTGTIVVDGLDTRQQDLAVRTKIGYLPENAPLYNDMLVSEYLAFVGEIRGMEPGRRASRIDEMVQVCGLTGMTGRQIGKLSKGYRQRVGLAQAMIHNPDLLILDEPTSGLDPNQIVQIRNLIKKIGEEKTVIYCSHILSEVSATCSTILIINNGSIVAQGTPSELMARATKGNRYTARIKAADGAAVQAKLRSIAGVSEVSVGAPADGYLPVVIAAEADVDLSETLFKCIVENGWSLSELKRESASLEDVFTQLTRG
ncbi:MAG: ATP-binding cassette domain-containing protein [Chitinivibrionales bacterium]|nr:ATP-binding cassette domain-containing protein [Chitinivibrionales bacterium]